MNVHEVLILKKFIDLKISDIKLKMMVCQDDKLAEELFVLLEQAQNYTRSITEVNMRTKVSVGKTETDVDAIVRVRGTLKHKVDILSDLIRSGSVDLDIITLLKQRDALVDEFILLDGIITRLDLETDISGEGKDNYK